MGGQKDITLSFTGNEDLNYYGVKDHPSPITQDVNIFGKFGLAVNVKLKPMRKCSHYMTARVQGQ